MRCWLEDREDCTLLYEVQTVKWSLCCSFFYLSEVFELTFIPSLYRVFFNKGSKPTFLEWLERHPRWWSTVKVLPKGTRFRKDSFSDLTLPRLYKIEWKHIRHP